MARNLSDEHRHVIDKMEKLQDDIFPALDNYRQEQGLPEQLEKALAPVVDDDATLDSYVTLADALGEYREMFDERTQRHIAQYREYVQELFQLDEGQRRRTPTIRFTITSA